LPVHPPPPPGPEWGLVRGPDTDDHELAALRDAFPGYRFRRRFVRGVRCYLAEARNAEPRPAEPRPAEPRPAEPRTAEPRSRKTPSAVASDAPLVAARNPAVLADMLAAAAGRPVRLRP